MRLVADIGGTNARVALSHGGLILAETVHHYANDEWDSLYAVLKDFLKTSEVQPDEMVIAVAGPVSSGRARLTNRDWDIEISKLKSLFGCQKVRLLNDLTALGHAAPILTAAQLRVVSVGAKKQVGFSQSLIVGIGTGFNVSPVLEKSGNAYCPAVEAGHITMPMSVAIAISNLGINPKQFETIELLFSGRGFSRFCREMTNDPKLEGSVAIERYGNSDAQDITKAIKAYSGLLGIVLRDLSMAYLPSSGIFLAGSIARAVLNVAPTPCIEELRRPCPILANFNPTCWTIEDDDAALTGCAEYAFE
ncbi:MAG: glucokinase [Sulfitobacter sp.]